MRTLLIAFFILFQLLLTAQTPLPNQTSTLFAGSGVCETCHAAAGNVLTTSTGRDICPVTQWRSTMMANAAKDPLWQAKVSAESAAHPALQSVLETKCTSCHCPMGKTEAFYNGAGSFILSQGTEDPLSMDGVSCTLCHQIRSDGLNHDSTFSAHFPLNNSHEIFGPFENPLTQQMISQSGFEPFHSDHISSSRLCATCHTLFTPYVDNQGNVAGLFPEQTPFLEWRNSSYVADGQSCQSCHMPAVEEAMTIATRPPWLATLRQPIYEHELAGGNAFMGQILRNNSELLEVAATAQQLDSTILKSEQKLREAVDVLFSGYFAHDTLIVDVTLENHAGHKFPTGFPCRRAWVYVRVDDSNGNTIFESGNWDEEGRILQPDQLWQPHYESISQPEQVQIYQALMKDVDDELTYTLLRGAAYLKDNRIPPHGYTSGGPDELYIAVTGNAVEDNNFNRFLTGDEGSATDLISYKIPAISGNLYAVTVKLCYQTMAPRFADDLFTYDTPQTILFEGMYDQQNNLPQILFHETQNIIATSINNHTHKDIHISPNPVTSSVVISGFQGTVKSVRIFSGSGEEYFIKKTTEDNILILDMSTLSPGVYIIYFNDGEDAFSRKVIRR